MNTKSLLLEQYRLKLELLRRATPPILEDIWTTDKRYIFLWGGRGGGKSESVAKYVLKDGNEKKLRILCTREFGVSIADSIHALLKDLINNLQYANYHTTDKTIVNRKTGTNFIYKELQQQQKKQTAKSLANIDRCIIEEAQTITKADLDILLPTIRKRGSKIIFLFNRLFPDDPVWRLMNSLPDELKLVIYTTYLDNPFLPQENIDLANVSKKEWEEGISSDYPHIWLGEPIEQGNDTVLEYRVLKDSIDRMIDEEGQESIGCDVARFGDDKTVFAKRKGLKLTDIKIFAKLNTVEVAKKLAEFAGNTKVPIKIDDTGVGGGVTDWLKEYGYNIIPINFGCKANDNDKYANYITEMWYEFKAQYNNVSLIDDIDLINELSSREYTIDNKERKVIEQKRDFKKRLGRSPDRADAVLLCYHNAATKPVFLKGLL